MDALPRASCGRHAIEQDGPFLLLVERGSAWTGVATAVLGLLLVIVVINALVHIPRAARRGLGFKVGGALLGLLALLGGALYVVRTLARQAEAAPPLVLLRIDPEGQRLLDPAGQPLAPLTQVSMARTLQPTSSYRALTLYWPGGERVVARGSIFSGGVDPCEEILSKHGVRRR